MFLRFYRMVAASVVLLLFGTIAATSAWAIDVTVTNTSNAVENGTAGQFTISTDSNVDNDTIVNFTLSGTAQDEAGETDYTIIDLFTTIPRGGNTATVDIATIDDNISEADESVILTLTSTDNASIVVASPNTATVTIVDDDAPTVSIQPLNDMVEGVAVPTGQFQFISTHDVDGGLEVTYTYSGTATYVTDYRDTSGTVTNTVTIAEGDGDLTEVVTLTLEDDDIAEGLETITATITGLERADVNQPISGSVIDPDNTTASIALTSNDTVMASITSGTAGAESGTNASFIVSLSDTATVPITIEYLDNSSTADNGTDYANLAGSLTIPAGSISSQINVTVLDDNLSDAGETIAIELDRVSAGPATIGSPSLASSVITDDDQALLTISAGQNGSEGVGDNATFILSLDRPAATDFAVNVTTGGTAQSVDFNPALSTVNFLSGEQTKTLQFAIVDDNISEGTETLIVTLDNASGNVAIGSPRSATRLIMDNDTATLSIERGLPDGVEATDTDTNFIIRTDTESSGDITVSFSIGGTATSGDDYASFTTTATIDAGNMITTVPIDVLQDSDAEDNETIIIALQNVTSGSAVFGSPTSVTLTIVDNDTVAANLGATTNTSEDNTSADGNFIVNLSSAAEADITLSYSLTGSAVSATDYVAPSGTVTILSGATTANVPIVAIEDNDVEGDETVTLTLVGVTSGPGRISGTPAASLTIADNDNASISISALRNGAEGGNSGQFLVSTNAAATEDYVISYAISGTATSSDYTDSGSGSITILDGDDNATINLPINDDAVIEDNETLTITLTAVTSGDATIGSNDNASITITSDDVATATIVHDNASEESGLVDGTLVVSLDNAAVVPITFGYTVTGTATSGSDYTALPGSVTFPAGSTEQVITVDVLQDSDYEDNETVIVTIDNVTSGPGQIGSPASANHIITSDDNLTLSLAVTANAEEPSTAGTFVISIPQTITEDIDFTYSVSGTATSGTDYSSIGTTGTIASSNDNLTITVTPISDNSTEVDETIILELTGVTSGPASLPATTSVTMYLYDNNTQTVTLSSPDNGAETGPDNASVRVTVPSAATADIDITYNVTGTATSGDDFTALSGSVTIDNGSSFGLITIPVLDDAIDEDNETVIITLSGVTAGPGRVGSIDNSTTLTITDNDNSTVGISVAAETEEGSSASFNVTLSAASSGSTTITYTDNRTATSGTDYTAPSGSLVIPAGST
ncbi:MAG: hypothetical protein J4F41_02470 [Alphaproteobacteria bacterium]|nr:hypothetical protein [Alphaproteobacteria bacterium]